MPFYEYRCGQGHTSTVRCSMLSRPNEVKCHTCGETAHRVFSTQRPIVKDGTPVHHHPGKK